jgi:hypothetical protein
MKRMLDGQEMQRFYQILHPRPWVARVQANLSTLPYLHTLTVATTDDQQHAIHSGLELVRLLCLYEEWYPPAGEEVPS